MKIAVACEKEIVTEHFGHCENFNIYETDGNKIVKSESVKNPGHRPGFLPNFLNDMGVNVIIQESFYRLIYAIVVMGMTMYPYGVSFFCYPLQDIKVIII
jgi:predicted Fe-Mo cluster-binding NifX family protein